MVGIRADANGIVASGHIMRCIAIAVQLKKLGEEILFVTADEYPGEMLKEAGFSSVVLHSDWKNMQEELTIFEKVISEYGLDKIVVDSYQVTCEYLKELQKKAKIIYIDDLFEVVYPADLIINYNGYQERFAYEKVYDARTKCLLGPSYAPLREEFFNASPKKKCLGSVLLSSGGGDKCRAMIGILKRAVKDDFFSKIVFHVIIGGFCECEEELRQFAESYENIILHRQVRNMAGLMGECELAVSAAGTMLYELCAMQIPTVFFMAADNQRYDSEYFEKQDCMVYAGDIQKDREECLIKVCESLKSLIEDQNRQAFMKDRLRMVTDGKGALRIAKEIQNL